ncbi:LLM class flavin-dependent oxidoreductase [Amycolatopsis jejuensis]|uniref:LLM class flavin-dependent oxidoreductase n=1 Tax=Amycolatopsis jejuensis TaxID=330084 RepID=UPI000525FBAB|nr:LLM class flavin-dependent oxidoreductase [Amycolatopsis jejuensis]
MDIGLFMAPYHLDYSAGRRGAQDVIEWDLQVSEWADRYGLHEAYFAEHYTIGREPSPAPDLMIAAAAQRTGRIRLGAAAHLLPYHHPISLAHRLMWLDHLTGGRYIAGFAPGSFPTDAQLFGMTLDQNAAKHAEALDIISAIWTRPPPFRLETANWTVDLPAYSEQWHGPHLKALQRPHPEVIVSGMQPASPSFQDAARRGFSPMSQQVGYETLCAHWETYRTSATDAGLVPDRARWRVLRDVFVAETDEEARRLVLEGAAGRTWREHLLPTFKAIRNRGTKTYALGELLVDPGMTIDDLTLEWLVDHFFLVGSPDTVVAKMEAFNEQLGGVGTVVSFVFDWSADPEAFRRNLELLGTEVAPRVAKVGPKG